MKLYKMVFNFTIQEGQGDEYSPPKPISVSVAENVPKGVCPLRHMAARISEEIKRQDRSIDLDYKDEDKEDPLDIVVPF